MRKLNAPQISHKEVILSCIINTRDENLSQKIEESINVFEDASVTYKENGEMGCLHTIKASDVVSNNIHKKHMTFLYNKMVEKKSSARFYYDQILHQTIKCPYCGYRTATTLDHYLPKSLYPVYAVEPLNLVPSCKDCNTSKLVKTAQGDISLLHPYYDNFDDERWLYCEVEYFETLAFKFTPKYPRIWSENKYSKLEEHFSSFDINSLLIVFASDEFSDSIFELKLLHENFGDAAVREILQIRYESCRYNLLNHWKTAMYDALRNDDEFLNWIGEFIVKT